MPIVSEPLDRVLGNRYRLVSALGTGASAHVFLAEDTVLQRRVAVKVLQPVLARDEAFLRRFRAEARSVAALNHPYVLRVFDWGEDDDGPYLVLEYLAGGSLFDMFARGVRLDHAQAVRLGRQAAEGLAYAHARGLVHRDVKPANILFDEEGRVRVADFGVARALAGSAPTEPAGAMIGTARYASPEQAQGLPLDGRSDVYSLALVLYETLTGAAAFTGETPLALLKARIGARLPADPGLGPLVGVLAWAASPDQRARPDAATLAERFGELADELDPPGPLSLPGRAVPEIPAVPPGGLTGAVGATGVLGADTTVAGPPTDPTAAAPARQDPGYRPPGARRRRRWPWIVTVVVVVLLLLGAGGLYAAKKKLFVPSHAVPSLVGDTVAAARRALTAEQFRLVVEPAVRSVRLTKGEVVRQYPRKGVSLKQGGVVDVTPSAGLPTVQVPSLSGGVDCAMATRLLGEVHLQATCPALDAYSGTIPTGDVINWSYDGAIDPTTAPYGSTISIAISLGHAPVAVPSLATDTYTQAVDALKAVGFSAKRTNAYSTTVPSGKVVVTTPPAGKDVPYGATVTVTVSEGPHMVTVPTVVGDRVAQATMILKKADLAVGPVYGPPNGKVFTSIPLAGQQVRAGSTVTLYTQ